MDEITMTKEEFDSKITEAVNNAVRGYTETIDKKESVIKSMKKKLADVEQIDPDEYRRLQEQIQELSTGKSNDADAARKQLEQRYQADLEKERKERESAKRELRDLVVETQLSSHLAAVNVAGPYMDAVKALFRSQVQVIEDENDRQVVIGSKPLADHIAEWAKSDSGKAFVAAPQNSGGGAGPRGTSGGGAAIRSKSDLKDAKAKAEYIAEHGTTAYLKLPNNA